MKITIEELQEYLFDHYKNGGIDQSLFMKLVEEIGEVAEVVNYSATELPEHLKSGGIPPFFRVRP